MRLLLDESIGIKVYSKLKQMGFDVVSVIHSMRGADDEEIIRKAIDEKRVIVTNDKDFGWLASLYKPPGVILLRLKDERTENKIKIITYVIEKHRGSILGNILVASEKKIRIRQLEKS
ncbi:MAG: DUF5615 family PIN-like protein [Thermoproteota archaeon]|nr:DUF5615 family PIN-like protein [Candidatus Brockarchaeota archaeon]